MRDLPRLQLETLFLLDEKGRILSTREPLPAPGPSFILIRGRSGCAWAAHAGVAGEVADELERLVVTEPALFDFHTQPANAERYRAILGGKVSTGPAFTFPAVVDRPPDTFLVEEEEDLHHFSGWQPGEIRAGRGPVMAILEDGVPVSICFCARRSDAAAEAGVETASAYRGRGYGRKVTAAWAHAVRESGLIPLYSTAWSNLASRSLARSLGLEAYAVDWSIRQA
jgi:hypothetical protein